MCRLVPASPRLNVRSFISYIVDDISLCSRFTLVPGHIDVFQDCSMLNIPVSGNKYDYKIQFEGPNGIHRSQPLDLGRDIRRT